MITNLLIGQSRDIMSKKQDKKIFQRKTLQEEEWIQMLDLRDKANVNMSKKFAQEEGKEYMPFRDTNLPQDVTNHNKLRQNTNLKAERTQPRKIKKISIPMMLVTCEFCTVAQSVPGNTQVYICGSCQNMNECEPLYGVFICGCCEAKICFGFGTSEFIKCVKCSSVNRVPSEPVKKYQTTPLPRPVKTLKNNQENIYNQKVYQHQEQEEQEREYDQSKYKQFDQQQAVYPIIQEQKNQSQFDKQSYNYRG